MKKIISIFIFLLVACSPYQLTVDDYVAAYPNVKLGMSKQEISNILSPSQSRLSTSEMKQPDKYMKDGVEVDIIYYRSGWQSDGLTTDDEFTPYVFNDDKLVAIGWQSIGGTKTQGQARSTSSSSSTVIVY